MSRTQLERGECVDNISPLQRRAHVLIVPRKVLGAAVADSRHVGVGSARTPGDGVHQAAIGENGRVARQRGNGELCEIGWFAFGKGRVARN